jgi:hypothetical protein
MIRTGPTNQGGERASWDNSGHSDVPAYDAESNEITGTPRGENVRQLIVGAQ